MSNRLDHDPDCLTNIARTGTCACDVPRIRQILREIEARDKGWIAPRQRIQVCGEPVEPHMPTKTPEEPSLRDRFEKAPLICPGCIRLRCSPIHLFYRIIGICDGRGFWI